MLAEITQCQEESISVSKGTVSDVLNILFLKYPNLEKKEFQVVEKQVIVSKDKEITASEIVLLPPFSGG